jgi:hypothetical protein
MMTIGKFSSKADRTLHTIFIIGDPEFLTGLFG